VFHQKKNVSFLVFSISLAGLNGVAVTESSLDTGMDMVFSGGRIETVDCFVTRLWHNLARRSMAQIKG